MDQPGMITAMGARCWWKAAGGSLDGLKVQGVACRPEHVAELQRRE
jgi:hypothetical protein